MSILYLGYSDHELEHFAAAKRPTGLVIIPGCADELDFELCWLYEELIVAFGHFIYLLKYLTDLFIKSLLIDLGILWRMRDAFLEESLEELEILLESIFAKLQVNWVLDEPLWLKVVAFGLALLPEWRRVDIVCFAFAFDVISDPFFEDVWKDSSKQMLIHPWQLRISMDAIVVLHDDLLTVDLVDERIEYEELMIAWI